MTWKRILWAVASPGEVQTDTSTVAKVSRLAIASGAELEIFHCVYDPEISRSDRFASRGAQLDIEHIVAVRQAQLDHNAESLRGRGVDVRVSVRWDYPAYEGIVRQVLRRKSDLLVARASQGSGAALMGLGQTDIKLIEACPSPLLLIKTARPYTAPRLIAAVDPMHAHDKPADLDCAIVDAARNLAAAFEMNLVLFHAVDQRFGRPLSAESRVQDLAERCTVDARDVLIVEGEVEERLTEVVRSEGAGVVALGAVSRSFLRRVLIGHTAERLLEKLDCDMLIAKPPGFRSSVSRRSIHRVNPGAASRGRSVL